MILSLINQYILYVYSSIGLLILLVSFLLGLKFGRRKHRGKLQMENLRLAKEAHKARKIAKRTNKDNSKQFNLLKKEAKHFEKTNDYVRFVSFLNTLEK